MEYVKKLKAACTEKEWEEYRERLIRENRTTSLSYQLLEMDGLYGRMLTQIEEDGSIWTLDQYETQLKGKFPEQVRDMYIKYVKDSVDKASDRSTYSSLARYLKKIRSYPDGEEIAEQIAAEWRRKYICRRALIEELRKAGFDI